jgi:hypothetical protein
MLETWRGYVARGVVRPGDPDERLPVKILLIILVVVAILAVVSMVMRRR